MGLQKQGVRGLIDRTLKAGVKYGPAAYKAYKQYNGMFGGRKRSIGGTERRPLIVEDVAENNKTKRLVSGGNHSHTGIYERKRISKRKLQGRKRTQIKKRKLKRKINKIIQPLRVWNYVYEDYATADAANSGVRIHTMTNTNPFTQQEVISSANFGVRHILAPGLSASGTASPYWIENQLVSDIGWVDDSTVQIGTAIQQAHDPGFFFKAKQTNCFALQSGDGAAYNFPMDIYECVAAQDISNVNYESPYAAYNYLQTNARTFQGETVTTKECQGHTPFKTPNFGKYWKILKVTRYLKTATDDTTSLANWTPYTFYTQGYYTTQKFFNNYAVKGVTKALLVIVNPINEGWITNTNGNLLLMTTNREFKFWTPSIDGPSGVQRFNFSTMHHI